jgi:hypothetical protein
MRLVRWFSGRAVFTERDWFLILNIPGDENLNVTFMARFAILLWPWWQLGLLLASTISPTA